MVTQQVSKLKRKKKKWCPILAPKLLNHKVLGETFVSDASLMNGRIITLNLMNITGEMKNQNVNATFKVQNVTDGKAYTELTGYEMISNSLRRFVRRGRSRIDDSFILKTADKKFVQVKPIIITNTLATKTVRTQLRLQSRNMLFSIFSQSPYERLLADVLFQKIQKQMRDVLKRIFPVKSCGLRIFRLLEQEPKNYLAAADYKIKKEPEQKPKTQEAVEEGRKESKPEHPKEAEPAKEPAKEERPAQEPEKVEPEKVAAKEEKPVKEAEPAKEEKKAEKPVKKPAKAEEKKAKKVKKKE